MRTLAIFVMLLLAVTAFAEETGSPDFPSTVPFEETFGANGTEIKDREERPSPEKGVEDADPTPPAPNEEGPNEEATTVTSGNRFVGGIFTAITFVYLF